MSEQPRAFAIHTGQHLIAVTAFNYEDAVEKAFRQIAEESDNFIPAESLGAIVEAAEEGAPADGRMYNTIERAMEMAGLKSK